MIILKIEFILLSSIFFSIIPAITAEKYVLRIDHTTSNGKDLILPNIAGAKYQISIVNQGSITVVRTLGYQKKGSFADFFFYYKVFKYTGQKVGPKCHFQMLKH